MTENKGDLISREALKEHKFLSPQVKVIGGRRCGKTREQIIEAYQKGWNDCIDAIIDNAPTVERFIVTTIPVTLSDGWGHVREAYYDASRQLVFTEAITRELLIDRGINITEQTEQLRNMRGGEES